MKIVSHGIRWVNDDKVLQCPECNSSLVDYTIDKNDTIYTAYCTCASCKCEFIIKRYEGGGE